MGGDGSYTWDADPLFLPPLALLWADGTLGGTLWQIPPVPVELRYTVTDSRPRTQKGGLQDYVGRLDLEAHPGRDFDGDGVKDVVDNCPFLVNPGQGDVDMNGVGDACETHCGLGYEVVFAVLLAACLRRLHMPGPRRRAGRGI